ncbi:MAG: helix-turn-helix transcriptional regulator [Clostridiales bacterium]|nr:helix-turn-helix transcriptional regulator [Clostridiales bacterium]
MSYRQNDQRNPMDPGNPDRWGDFFLEMSERAVTAREFFDRALLDSLKKHFGYQNVILLAFDAENHFLSWITGEGLFADCEDHPYRRYAPQDQIRRRIYEDAVCEHLDYFNVSPKLYRSTDLIDADVYEASAHVRFLEENFRAHYSLHFAMGVNAYLQIVFLKSREEGDFTGSEQMELARIYSYIASAYRNFKKYEQARIVSEIHDEVILSGETAYLITDDFMHIMDYNQEALACLKKLLGGDIVSQIDGSRPCVWLPFLLSDREPYTVEKAHIHMIRNYTFRIYTYDRTYSHGIVDKYHWITISDHSAEKASAAPRRLPQLTKSENRIAGLLYSGLTYQAIAGELVISYHTVKNHVQNIYSKCGVKNRYELYELMKENES